MCHFIEARGKMEPLTNEILEVISTQLAAMTKGIEAGYREAVFKELEKVKRVCEKFNE